MGPSFLASRDQGIRRIVTHFDNGEIFPLPPLASRAKIPDQFRHMGSVEFSKMLIRKCQVAVSPGLGFGEYGDDFVRFALIENNMRINQAVRGIRKILQ